MKNFNSFISDLKDLIAFNGTKQPAVNGMPFGEQVQKTLECFDKIAKRMGFDTEAMYNKLLEYINGQHVVPFLDEHVMNRYHYLATEKAAARERSEITVRMLLECMADEPTEALKPFFAKKEQATEPTSQSRRRSSKSNP